MMCLFGFSFLYVNDNVLMWLHDSALVVICWYDFMILCVGDSMLMWLHDYMC